MYENLRIKTDPKLLVRLRKAAQRQMTPGEIEAQRKSFVQAIMGPCEHGHLVFEYCPWCSEY